MLSILLGHSYFLSFDRKQLERAKPYPPLATLQVAALLREAGHRVSLFDAMLAEDTADYERQLAACEPRLAVFYEDNFNYLSKMCLGKMRAAAFEMIAAARRRGCTVIAAGSDASDAAVQYLKAGADCVLLGEGLDTLPVLAARLAANPQISRAQWVQGLSGIAAFAEGELYRSRGTNPPPKTPPALPAWDLIDMDRYRQVWRGAHGYFSLNMAASRGCSFRCNWCAKPIWGHRYLQREPAEVAAEMAYLKQSFQPDHIWFADDIFGFRPDWVERFATAARNVDGIVPFTIQTRADLMSVRMAQTLASAGCYEAWIGAESGSQRILDAMNKGTTVEQILTARARLKDYGIRVGFFIQIGYLGEQLEDLLATRDLIEHAQPDDIGVSVSYPLPGTRFYELVKEQLQDKTHWNESDDLAMMFQGTYTSEFYRAVRDLLHAQVELDKDNSAAQIALRWRWDALLAQERGYRSPSTAAAAATA